MPFDPADPNYAAKCSLAAEVLRSSGRLDLVAAGASMLPSLRPGDGLTIHRAHFDEVSPGDIVYFVRDGRPFVHRVVRRDGDELVTQGDSLADEDPPVTSGQILGRVMAVRRGRASFAPPAAPSRRERLLCSLYRRSHWAGRIALRWYELNRVLRENRRHKESPSA
ncbi:MAG: S24/S26 family peptidase [Bryobacteraceae bacterium]